MIDVAHFRAALLITLVATGTTVVAEATKVAAFSSGSDAFYFGADDIIELESDVTGETGEFALLLNEAGAAALAILTENNVGQVVSFTVCEQEIIQVVVNAPIQSGILQVDDLPTEQVQSIDDILNGRSDCAD